MGCGGTQGRGSNHRFSRYVTDQSEVTPVVNNWLHEGLNQLIMKEPRAQPSLDGQGASWRK